MTIKAIETSYKGYRFRSRLEARWAVYFDALGCDWEYEPQGFDLGDGVLYLPDFRVGWRTGDEARMYWAEVKPDDGNGIAAEDQRKIDKFVRTVGPVVLLLGTPAPVTYPFLEAGVLNPGEILQTDIVLASHKGKGRFYLSTGEAQIPRPLTEHERDYWYEILPAVTAARSARFEHGETPK